MREIKFRAWDGEGMFLQDDIGDDFDFVVNKDGLILLLNQQYHECGSGVAEELWNYVETKAEFMQFIGIQDEDGVDIYEGDIVEYISEYQNKPSIHFVQYEGGQGYPAFELSPNLGFECNGFAGICQGSSGVLKKIGNIHQNKELL
jgi:uncharacterized phage protein (TIGR01671 family)